MEKQAERFLKMLSVMHISIMENYATFTKIGKMKKSACA